MKKILGLDLGTASIGWALVNEAENKKEKSAIVKTGVRIIQYDTFDKVDKLGNVSESKNPTEDFTSGKGLSPNAKRTKQRGSRKTLRRYQDRRENLIELLRSHGILKVSTVLYEEGKSSTHSLWRLRAKAATEEIGLADFARVLLAINKKRGYKSNRKTKDEGDGQAIDGMEVAKKLYNDQLTPGQYAHELLANNIKHIPDFYQSDLQAEFDQIWECQKRYYPEILTEDLQEELNGKNKGQTWKICEVPFEIVGVKRVTKGNELKKENYKWREMGLSEKLDLEQLAVVLQETNNNLSNSSGYLGAISDRSKQLIFNDQTVGQYLFGQLSKNPHSLVKNQVFYRQDYLDEFERIWDVQSKNRKDVLTDTLKTDIRDVVIFYQRRLKSQKGLISICELEGKEKEIIVEGKKKMKIIGPRAIPKSSPLFQEFKIWQILNNLEFRNIVKNIKTTIATEDEDLSIRKMLFEELNLKGKLSDKQLLHLVFTNSQDWELNFENIEGNRTNELLFKAYSNIIEMSGHEIDSKETKKVVSEVFEALGIKKEILDFDAELEGPAFEKQPGYQLWHLLYSYEGDSSTSGNDGLLKKLEEAFGFEKKYAQHLVNITFQDDYGSLSTKAIRKILPFLKEGKEYSDACVQAGYNHSHSLTKEENEKRKLTDHLELLPKNSLRNPVVEKILNQMVNVVNAVIDKYGKPDEIRIELARELKKSAKERAEMTKGISESTRKHDAIRGKIKELYPFNTGVRITRNDLLKYKLYEELDSNGHKTFYTNTYVPLEKLFSKDFDIEHIIPRATLFDDSFSNKTLAVRQINLDKGNKTAFDFLAEKYGEESNGFKQYLERIEKLYKDKEISKSKYTKLLMKGDKIPDGFIERDLRNTQYIAKKALQMLHIVVRTVTPTTGMITEKLREDWQLINVMQELNWDKYEKLGLTTTETNKQGDQIRKIVDWTKRNDHRHHAMDAITVAFTKSSLVQYFNYLNARKDKNHKMHKNIQGIEQNETYTNDKNKRLVKPPIPMDQFRAEAKMHLENTLVSFKARNKVLTSNKNKIQGKEGPQITLTPRGQLHKETIYGKSSHYVTKEEKVGPKFDKEKINSVAKKLHREALLNRLKEFGNDPQKAFGGKNSLVKNPIYLDEHHSEKLPEKIVHVSFEERYTIRKEISPDNFKDLKSLSKVVDKGVRCILEKRLADFDGDAKKAFANLEEKPIWLVESIPENKWKEHTPSLHELGIPLKRVTITGVSKAESLHTKKDQYGKEILDSEGKPIPVDYVSTGNNHHVAIYKDEKGQLQEDIVSFHYAVSRANAGTPIIWKILPEQPEWQFLFTMKQNEYFVFPNGETGFDPNEIDLMDEKNHHLISSNLFRVQKISTKNYVFNHHLETLAVNKDTLKNKKLSKVTYNFIQTPINLEGIVKVRLNHLGQIVKVGEY